MKMLLSDEMNTNNYVISATVLQRLLDAAAAARYSEVSLASVCVYIFPAHTSVNSDVKSKLFTL